MYEVLQRRLTAHLAGEGSIDIRDVHVFWEHKALMVARLERIARDIPLPGALIQEARELEVQAKSLYLAYMMHEVAPERGGLERLVAELPRTRRRDAALCQALLEAIASSRTGGDQECR